MDALERIAGKKMGKEQKREYAIAKKQDMVRNQIYQMFLEAESIGTFISSIRKMSNY